MKATQFNERRLPKVGDTIYDKLNECDVEVVEVRGSKLIIVKGGVYGPNDSYGRGPQYFRF